MFSYGPCTLLLSSSAINTWRSSSALGGQMLAESSFECSICFNLLLDPVCVSCGHDFCKVGG